MKQINSYLTFGGNCREAMTYYAACLGGELVLQKINESPLSDKLPKEMREYILHATLTAKSFVLMGSDMVSETGLIKGNSVSLMLNCTSENETKKLFKKLSSGGSVKHKLENTFWGALFGDLTDKFGNNWILHFDKNKL
jgi:PhnB protein